MPPTTEQTTQNQTEILFEENFPKSSPLDFKECRATKGTTLGFMFNKHSNNFNIMRLIAAFAVIYGHAGAVTGKGPPDIFLQLIGFKFIGGVAVDVFFVISGYLITASIFKKNGLKYYIASRVLRIYPALIICITLTVFLVGPVLTESKNYWSDPTTWKYFWRNATAFRTEYFLPGVFTNLHDRAINGSLWSLAIEVRLYFTILIVSIVGIFRSTTTFNFLFFFILISGYLNAPFINILLPNENYRNVSLMFMLGSFSWINKDNIPISPVILLFLLFIASTTHGTAKFNHIYPIVMTYLVLFLAVSPRLTWFDKIGDYSYGVYLYGWLSQQLILVILPTASNEFNAITGGLLALFLAIISWHYIEKPFLNLKNYFIVKG